MKRKHFASFDVYVKDSASNQTLFGILAQIQKKKLVKFGRWHHEQVV